MLNFVEHYFQDTYQIISNKMLHNCQQCFLDQYTGQAYIYIYYIKDTLKYINSICKAIVKLKSKTVNLVDSFLSNSFTVKDIKRSKRRTWMI